MKNPIEGNQFRWKGQVWVEALNRFDPCEVVFTIADDFSYVEASTTTIPLSALKDLMHVIEEEFKTPVGESLELIRFSNMCPTTQSLPTTEL